MAKKLLAILLAMLTLVSVFGVTASAAYEPVAEAAEGPQGAVIVAPFNAPSRSIVRRIERYVRIAEDSGNPMLFAEVEQLVWNLNGVLFDVMVSTGRTNRLGANLLASTSAIFIARTLRQAGELSIGAYLWSMILGHMWWLWVPIAGVALTIGGIVLRNVLRG
jgi:hypothetical protein